MHRSPNITTTVHTSHSKLFSHTEMSAERVEVSGSVHRIVLQCMAVQYRPTQSNSPISTVQLQSELYNKLNYTPRRQSLCAAGRGAAPATRGGTGEVGEGRFYTSYHFTSFCIALHCSSAPLQRDICGRGLARDPCVRFSTSPYITIHYRPNSPIQCNTVQYLSPKI